MGKQYPSRQKHVGSVFYGFDAEDDSILGPLQTINPRDDVSGLALHPDEITIQDGMVKDRRPEKGSIENDLRHTAGAFFFVQYDPALGVQQHPAGYYED